MTSADTPATVAREDLRAGAIFAVLAAAAFALMSACVKAVSAEVATEVVVFFRSGVSLLVLLPWLLRSGTRALVTQRPAAHLWRAVFGTCAVYCFFYAIAHLQLSEAILLTYSTPLFIPFIAWLWLREPPAPVVLLAIGLGLAGIVLIARPGAALAPSLATGLGVLSAVCASCAMVGIRRMSDTEPAVRIVFYFSALSTAVAAVPLLWAWRTPSPMAAVLLVATGVFATIGQLSLTRAYGLAPAARIGAFAYSSVVFGGLLGWALWRESPDAWSLAGMTLVVACCLAAGWRGK
ncbi:MAG TPA: DMT family transporter [Verrucomicrobiae bacterium]|nr:DMT family transporter [Verrucomicrobiae bacterium]